MGRTPYKRGPSPLLLREGTRRRWPSAPRMRALARAPEHCALGSTRLRPPPVLAAAACHSNPSRRGQCHACVDFNVFEAQVHSGHDS